MRIYHFEYRLLPSLFLAELVQQGCRRFARPAFEKLLWFFGIRSGVLGSGRRAFVPPRARFRATDRRFG